MRIVVTGGAGFIGSNFVRFVLREHPDDEVVVLDKLTYAGNLENLEDVAGDPRYTFVRGDICDPEVVAATLDGADAVVNFAAETHVDRSISGPQDFIRTDVLGTHTLLEAVRVARRRPLPAGLDRRGLRIDRRRVVHRGVPARPVEPVLGEQGGRRPPRALLRHAPTARRR